MNSKLAFAFFASFVSASITPHVAGAATLGLELELPALESSSVLIDYFEFGMDGDLSAFGAEVDFVDGVSPSGFTELGFGVGFALSNPAGSGTGGFDIFDENGEFLSGDLLSVGFTTDMIELQFGNLGGFAASSFNSTVLLEIAFDDSLGDNPFTGLVDGQSYVASAKVSNVAEAPPLPIPGTLMLVLPALLALSRFRHQPGNHLLELSLFDRFR